MNFAADAGWPGEKLSFTGPAKRDEDLRRAIELGVGHVVVESIAEAQRLSAIAQANAKVQPIIVRISPMKVAPGFGSRMSGKPTQFGIDEETIDSAIEAIGALPSLRLEGMHVYSGSQCLQVDAIVQAFCIDICVVR